MNIIFTKSAWKDFLFFRDRHTPEYERIVILLKDVAKSPFSGIGKPEALKGNLSGYWSRRINKKHRLVYEVENEEITVISCRYHYSS